MIGNTIGNYRVISLLGEGGMGVVYEAEHPGIGRRVAIKILHPGLTQDQDITNRFFNEARAANAIRHPGIVEVFDFGTLPSGASYIVMELLGGESLASRLARVSRLSLAEVRELGAQTAGVLAAAHAGGIVHRDLKPDNLFLVPDDRNPGAERVKVLDFGIAKLGLGSSGSVSVKTRTGAVMGTPAYMSPEQCRGTREVDHRTDIYALGVILYEMVCGRPPFVSEGFGEMVHLHISAPPTPPRALLPTLPQDLEAVILRCLEKEPANRFQSMSDLPQALLGRPVPAFPPTVAKPGGGKGGGEVAPVRRSAQTTFSQGARGLESTTQAPARRSALGPILAGLVLAAAAIGGTLLWRGRTRPPDVAEPSEVHPPATTTTTTTSQSPSPPPSAQLEHLTVTAAITSTPPGARVVRDKDGAVIGVTPFRENWRAGAGVQKLRIEMSGYRSESVTVPLDRGVNLAFVLKTAESPPAAKKRPPPRRTPSAPASQPAKPPGKPEPPLKSEPVPL